MYKYIRKYKGENDKEFESRVNTALNSIPENTTVTYTVFSDNFVTIKCTETKEVKPITTVTGFNK